MIAKLNIMPMKLSLLTQQETFILRFFVGMMVAIILAFGFDWPFAFITPVFVAKFLGAKREKIPFKALVVIGMIVTAAFILGGIMTRLFLPYPIVFVLMITLFIFWVSYWNNSGGNELVVTMLLVGFTVIPMLGLLNQVVAEQFTIGFLFSCLISIVITMMMFELIPNKENIAAKAVEKPNLLPEKSIRVRYALLSTLMIVPVLVFFMYFKLSSSLLVLVFIAILAQKPDLVAGVKGSKALLVGNSIGAICAIVMYNLLVMAPDFIFLVLLFALIVIVFGKLIFSNRPFAPLYAMAFSTVVILISSATLGNSDAEGTFYTRIFQIAYACFYVIFATVLASPWIRKISKL